MIDTRYYMVAGHRFGVSSEAESFTLMENYEPFKLPPASPKGGTPDAVFTLSIESGEAPVFTEELSQEDDKLLAGNHKTGLGQVIICGKTANGMPVFEFRWMGDTAGWLVCSTCYDEGRLITTGHYTKMVIDNALMVLYSLATADKGTVLFHAAAVSHGGKGYLFLGPSGTGKSTHAQLWLKHIIGTELVNDDNPVVRIEEPAQPPHPKGHGTVYGSPWSGKTPCYRNVSFPLGGIVLLSQAPYNKIRQLGGIEAYAALVASISGKWWDKRIANGLHLTENTLVSSVPTWHLECLPNEEAARVCAKKIETTAFTDIQIIEEAIRLVNDGVSVTLPVDGRSMLPFIIGGQESVILQKPVQPKVGQVVLAWVSPGRYVVHRIITIDGNEVTLMGDGNLSGTEHCTTSDIKAVATHVVDAKEHIHELYNRWRRWAARLWRWLRPLRRYLLTIYRRVHSI